MSFHFKRSCSKWERLAICPGSNRQSEGIPDEPSKYAVFGTQSHAVLEAMLKDQPYDMLPLDDDPDQALLQIAYARQCAEFVKLLAGDGGWYSEMQVNIATYTREPGATSTLDIGMVVAAPELGPNALEIIVIDYKTGHNRVRPDNWQLYGYGFGFEDWLTPQLRNGQYIARVRLIIYQPPHGGPAQHLITDMREWNAKKKEIRTVMARVDEAERARTQDIAYHLRASAEGCRYCPAAGALSCPARAAWRDQYVAGIEHFDKKTLVAAADMATLDRWYAGIPMLESFIKDVQAAMRARLDSGQISTAAKIVLGQRGRRTYTDAQKAYAAAVAGGANPSAVADTVLLSPAKLEEYARYSAKLAGLPAGELPMWFHGVDKFIFQAESKPTLAPIDDPRPSITLGPSSFTDLRPQLTLVKTDAVNAPAGYPPGFIPGDLF